MRKIFKRCLVSTMALALVVSGIALPTKNAESVQAADDGYELVWADEFNGTALDESAWTYETGNGNWGWGNGELQYYRKENVSVSGGNLQIQAKREGYGGCDFTSGRIITRSKKYFQYGKMEARIKVENGNQSGVWPAYWMLGQNSANGVGWPNCGEIDIMEHANSNNYVCGTLHWNTKGINGANRTENYGQYGSGHAGKNYVFSDNTNNGINGWHTYTLIWDKRHMEWQVDGVTYFSQDLTSNNAYCFRNQFFFIFNVAIGGPQTGFTNYQTADANFRTTTMYVDYLRVYQQPEEETTTQATTKAPVTTTKPIATTTATVPTTKYNGNDNTGVIDAVQTAPGNWEVWTGMGGSATHTLLDGKKGVEINADAIGTDLWSLQTHIDNLSYVAGETYNYKCTITSDVDKVVRLKVVGNDDNHIIYMEDIAVKPGVPYYFNKDIVIPADYDSVLNLYFGLGKTRGDTLSSSSAMNITISDVSFSRKVENPTTVAETTASQIETTAIGAGNTSVETEKTVVAKAKIKKAKRAKSNKKINLTIKKIKGVSGYKIKYSTSKKFKKKQTKTITVKKNVTKIKKLKVNKKYYIKVRAFKKVNGKNVYGKWSKVKVVKVKK